MPRPSPRFSARANGCNSFANLGRSHDTGFSMLVCFGGCCDTNDRKNSSCIFKTLRKNWAGDRVQTKPAVFRKCGDRPVPADYPAYIRFSGCFCPSASVRPGPDVASLMFPLVPVWSDAGTLIADVRTRIESVLPPLSKHGASFVPANPALSAF